MIKRDKNMIKHDLKKVQRFYHLLEMLEMLEGVLELCCRNPSHKRLRARSGRRHSPYILLDIQ